MANIPEGYGIIAGRGRENAQAAIAAAIAAGLTPDVVRTVSEGYLVPDAVLVQFHAAKEPAEKPVKSKPAAKKSTQKAGSDAPEAEAPAEAVEDEKEE